VLCVLGKGYWIYDFSRRRWNGGAVAGGTPLYAEFCGFMTGFMNSLASDEASLRPFKPGYYINFTDFIAEWKSVEGFRSPDNTEG
jgi:hypothetical protein